MLSELGKQAVASTAVMLLIWVLSLLAPRCVPEHVGDLIGLRPANRLPPAVRAPCREVECYRLPQSPARPAARWRRCQPLPIKPFAEGVSVRRIREAITDVVLFFVMPRATSPRFDASFAMKGQNVVGLDSEAA
jgi:hypothetical protein